jgi:hypothetical protein
LAYAAMIAAFLHFDKLSRLQLVYNNANLRRSSPQIEKNVNQPRCDAHRKLPVQGEAA